MSETANPWNNAQLISVLCAVDEDQRTNHMEANVDLACPVCKQNTLYYDRSSMFDMTAWCRTCNTGLQQGKGAALTGAKP